MKMGYVVQTGVMCQHAVPGPCIEALGLCTFEEELDNPTHEHEVPDIFSHEGECST